MMNTDIVHILQKNLQQLKQIFVTCRKKTPGVFQAPVQGLSYSPYMLVCLHAVGWCEAQPRDK